MYKVDVSEVKGPLGELMDQLTGENGTERLREFNLWLKGVAVKLLKCVGEIQLGPIGRFVAADKFTKVNPKVKFYYFGKNFTDNFLGKIEDGVEAATISVQRLLTSAHDPEIMVELGVKYRIITLAQFYGAIELQGQGQQGELRIDGWANLAYIRDINGSVWAVIAYWDAGNGWLVNARPVDSSAPWHDGGQVLSRKFV